MNNLFCFHGIDHKVGVTMVTQSTAELIALQNPNLNILLISLNGRKNCEYVQEEVKTIDSYKLQMDSKMILCKEFMRDCKYKENLYLLAGLENEQEERYYFPDSAKYLLEAIEGSFDFILADTGSELDNGLALGGMAEAQKNYLVMTQLESNLNRHMKRMPWFKQSNISFERIIINKFSDENPYTLNYIAERLHRNKEEIYRVQSTGYGCEAEAEQKTFMDFKSDIYKQEITMIANDILENAGFPQLKVKTKGRLWKNFI